mgnify:CR=1 FL=1
MASPRRTLITGAARPLGVELVRQCLIRGDKVYAAARNPARVPVLADLRPSGRYLMSELIAIGGIRPLLKTLLDAGTLDKLKAAVSAANEQEAAFSVNDEPIAADVSGFGKFCGHHKYAPPVRSSRLLVVTLVEQGAARRAHVKRRASVFLFSCWFVIWWRAANRAENASVDQLLTIIFIFAC